MLSLVISLMVIPPVVLVVPLFLLGAQLNLIDTRRIVIAIYVGLMMPFSVYMLAAYFRTIPSSLIQAAEIDGASSLQVFLQVVLPLSRAPLITLAVVNALWVWNELLIALVFLQSQDSLTLMAGLTDSRIDTTLTSRWSWRASRWQRCRSSGSTCSASGSSCAAWSPGRSRAGSVGSHKPRGATSPGRSPGTPSSTTAVTVVSSTCDGASSAAVPSRAATSRPPGGLVDGSVRSMLCPRQPP